MSKYSRAVKKGKPLKSNPKTGIETRRLPKKADRVSFKFGHVEWRKLFAEANKFPLSTRIAAELYRNGVSASTFESKFHYEDNVLSKNVLEELMNMDRGKGVEPETVPPVLPVVVKMAEPEKKRIRPSKLDAAATLKQIFDDLLKAGWKQEDLFRVSRELLPDPDRPLTKVVKAVIDDDALLVPPKVVKVVWPAGHTGECACCGRRLNGLSVRVKEDEIITDYHYPCYHLKIAKPVDLMHGQSFTEPASGQRYVWDSTKPAWVPVSSTAPTKP